MQWLSNMIHTVLCCMHHNIFQSLYQFVTDHCWIRKKKTVEENTQGNMKLMFTSLYFKHKIYTNPKLIKYINQKINLTIFPAFALYHLKGLCLLLHKMLCMIYIWSQRFYYVFLLLLLLLCLFVLCALCMMVTKEGFN